jgi:hypothetical protein
MHREIGVHITKVRSTTLDTWSLEQVEVMKKIGNAKVNAMYEAKLPKGRKPTADTDDDETKRFVRDKYEHKVWYRAGGKKKGGKEETKDNKKKKKKADDSDDSDGDSARSLAPPVFFFHLSYLLTNARSRYLFLHSSATTLFPCILNTTTQHHYHCRCHLKEHHQPTPTQRGRLVGCLGFRL